MALSAPAVTLPAATATLVASGAKGTATVPVSVVLWNASGATIWIGGPGVTNTGTTQGIPVANSSFSPALDLTAGDDLYAYSVAGGLVNTLVTRQ